MANNYVVTAQKSTVVLACVTGNFTSPNDLNLILARNNHLEVHSATPTGLRPLKEVNINGQIAAMRHFRPPGSSKELLFVLTQRQNVMILELHSENDEVLITTRAHGSVYDPVGVPNVAGAIAVIDPKARVIGMYIYSGLFTIIPLDKETVELKAVNLRMEEFEIFDVEFLHGCANPTIVVIHKDGDGRHVKTHEINLREKEFNKVPWKQDNVETEATMLIPVLPPLMGVIVIGRESIVYHDGKSYTASAPPVLRQSTVVCYARVDNNRFVLGNMDGQLYMLLAELTDSNKGQQTIKELKVELLGEISIPECITYLDNGFLFVGSRHGDSQLVRLVANANEQGSYVVPVEIFVNLAPILDLAVVDLDRQGQGQIITCSGSFKDGSLRIIRIGIGIQEHASIDLGGVKGMWSLQVGNEDSNYQNTLVLSFVGITRILTIAGDEVEETKIGGFESTQPTLLCANVNHKRIIQITRECIRLVSVVTQRMVFEWKPKETNPIAIVACNTAQIVVASGCLIYYLEIENDCVVEVSSKTLDSEVACVDVTPLDEKNKKSNLLAVGLWTDTSAVVDIVLVLSLPDMNLLYREKMKGEIMPRSILMTQFEGINYLLAALGDGSMYYFLLDKNTGTLTERKKVVLGTQPISLRTFKSLATTNVFACSDRPTVIYSSNRKLVFSNVNLKEVNHMCSLNAHSYPDSLALASSTSIILGTIDEIQKLHIRTVPLYESPRRIAYQESTKTFGLATLRIDIQSSAGPKPVRQSASTITPNITYSNNMLQKATGASPSAGNVELGAEVDIFSFLIIDQNTFEVLCAYQFIPSESIVALMSAKLGDDPNTYYVLATAIVYPEDPEPKLGRILIFHFQDSKLSLVAETKIDGACFSLVEFNGKVLAGIGSFVRLYEWTSEKELRMECNIQNNISALYIKAKGDFILVGDLMRSITLLQHKSMEGIFVEIARDCEPKWMRAIEILDDDTFLGSESNGNLFVCIKDSSATSDEERQLLPETGRFHLGDIVNVFQHGSLVMQNVGERTIPNRGCVLYGTVSGAIGIVTHFPSEFFDFLRALECRLQTTVKSLGKIDHSSYRNAQHSYKPEPSEGFIDGDLIENFLDLTRAKMAEVVKNLEISVNGEKRPVDVDYVIKIVEDLTRLH